MKPASTMAPHEYFVQMIKPPDANQQQQDNKENKVTTTKATTNKTMTMTTTNNKTKSDANKTRKPKEPKKTNAATTTETSKTKAKKREEAHNKVQQVFQDVLKTELSDEPTVKRLAGYLSLWYQEDPTFRMTEDKRMNLDPDQFDAAWMIAYINNKYNQSMFTARVTSKEKARVALLRVWSIDLEESFDNWRMRHVWHYLSMRYYQNTTYKITTDPQWNLENTEDEDLLLVAREVDEISIMYDCDNDDSSIDDSIINYIDDLEDELDESIISDWEFDLEMAENEDDIGSVDSATTNNETVKTEDNAVCIKWTMPINAGLKPQTLLNPKAKPFKPRQSQLKKQEHELLDLRSQLERMKRKAMDSTNNKSSQQ